jgi:hypothetical protein
MSQVRINELIKKNYITAASKRIYQRTKQLWNESSLYYCLRYTKPIRMRTTHFDDSGCSHNANTIHDTPLNQTYQYKAHGG